jgi:putative endonuclease
VAEWYTCLPAGRRKGLKIRYNKSMHFVYVLRSEQKKYLYVGLTNNLERRISQHQNGREQTTSPYRPFELVYTEKYPTRAEARKREKQLKSGQGKEWLKSKYPYKV